MNRRCFDFARHDIPNSMCYLRNHFKAVMLSLSKHIIINPKNSLVYNQPNNLLFSL